MSENFHNNHFIVIKDGTSPRTVALARADPSPSLACQHVNVPHVDSDSHGVTQNLTASAHALMGRLVFFS
jgi:hypothetical protein